MRPFSTFILCLLAIGPVHSVGGATVTHTVVVRDHLKAVSSEIVISGKRGDTTAGSWIGTLPGIDGLPTPPISDTPPFMLLRHPLQKTNTPPGWPGRIGSRLDFEIYTGSYRPRCSGSLVGPRFFLTAAHCVISPTSISTIQEEWISDSFYVRPGFDHGRDVPGTSPTRVVKSYVSKSVFPIGTPYDGDNDWAILELATDPGTLLGWAQVVPMSDDRENEPMHMLGYPIFAPACPSGQVCDTATRRDTLHHSWSHLWRYHEGTTQDWCPEVTAWQGESGSGTFDCPDDSCKKGIIHVRATRWKDRALSSIDSTMSGVIAAILKDVKVPTGIADRDPTTELEVRSTSRGIEVSTARIGVLEVRDARGRTLVQAGSGTRWSLDRLDRTGVLVFVVRFPEGTVRSSTIASTRN